MTNPSLIKRLLLLSASVLLGWSTYVKATLDLSTIPLVVSGVADPNVMFLMDTSGSMAHVLMGSSSTSTYDATDTAWNNCDASLTLSSADVTKVELKISLSTDTPAYKPWFTTSGSVAGEFDWGNAGTTSDTGTTGRPVRCFASDQTFPAQLSVDLATALPTGTVHGTVNYSGHYLNYYFGSALARDWTGSHHPDEHSRMQAAQSSFSSLITSMNSVRAGLIRLEGELGAHILQPVAELNDTHKTALLNAADGLSPNGYTSTPLADVFHKLGKYFVGDYIGDLILHPDSTMPVTKTAGTVFHKSPTYADAIDQSSPIGSAAFCRRNFIIAVSGGEPTAATEISEASGLRTYNDAACPDCTTHMDDVVKALFDMDLRPDIDHRDGTEFKNNIRTFLLGLASSASTLFTKTAEAGGTGQPYFMDDADQLLVEFNSVMSTIHAQNGSVASVAFNASQLNSDSAVYQAKFNTGRWSGSLLALDLSDTGDIADNATWDAAVKLDGLTPANRQIMTQGFVDPAVDNTIGGTPFLWANLTDAQKNDLGYDGDGTRDDTLGGNVLNYLRGDRSNEGSATGNFRVRDSRLGDIVNSTPVFVGPPELNWPDYTINNKFGGPDSNTTDTYDDGSHSYYKHMTVANGGAADRTQVIYTGANDGMLHGFNASLTHADRGKELFAYIPSPLYSSSANDGLHYLADRHYAHKFYVDLTPTVSDVYIDPAGGTSRSWRTILVGGLGAGGRGLFALDITDPTRFGDLTTYADDILLWEFTSGDNPDLGYTFSRPTVAMMQNGKWAVIVGNGYNSSNHIGKLFILFIEAGVDGWAASDYVVLNTKVGTAEIPNGLSTPRVVDLDGDSVADRIYTGDLQGNMWAFNVSSATASDWGPAYGTLESPLPLFTAKDSTGKAQPITAAPVARKNPNGTTEVPNVLVLFGTGKFLETGDIIAADPMTYYAVWDAGTGGLLRGDLVGRAVTDSGGIRTIVDGAAIIDWNLDHGWYLELNSSGERVVTDSLLRRDVVFFNTIMPSDTVCEAGGTGWLMALDFATGKAPTFAVFDANNDGQIDAADIGKVGYLFQNGLPTQSGMLGDKQYTPGSDGSIQVRDIEIGKGTKEGTLSWEEIYRK